MASISGLSKLARKLLRLERRLIRFRQTLSTSLNIRLERAQVRLRWIRIERISVSSYASKALRTLGTPLSDLADRQATNVSVTLWPVPDVSTYTLSYYRLRGVSGVSSGIGTTADVPPRFVPCLAAELAYYIAMKKPEVAARVAPLKQEYEFQFELAAGEDTDSSSIKFVPYDTFYLGG